MSSVSEIQKAIIGLSRDDYQQLRRWLYEYDSPEWNRQIETDSADGKLDALAAQAEEAKQRGNGERPLVHRTAPESWSPFDSLLVVVREWR